MIETVEQYIWYLNGGFVVRTDKNRDSELFFVRTAGSLDFSTRLEVAAE